MKRKDFINKSIKAGLVASAAPLVMKSAETKESHQIGFNHLPNQEKTTMNTVLHKSTSRGHANHGWLDSHHTFSFANYHNPDRMHFGVLRVLNDDIVAAGKGFGTHPHDNMEIISIPLQGDLEHKDSMNNVSTIRQGDIQVMSAGTGVTHSEYNRNKDSEVKFLQIWVYPREKNVSPRYDQISIKDLKRSNDFYQVLSPNAEDEGVWIHQDAWFHMAHFDSEKEASYLLKKKGNGVYFFVLDGEIEVNGQVLSDRDGYGLWDLDKVSVKANKKANVLLLEVPMSA